MLEYVGIPDMKYYKDLDQKRFEKFVEKRIREEVEKEMKARGISVKRESIAESGQSVVSLTGSRSSNLSSNWKKVKSFFTRKHD